MSKNSKKKRKSPDSSKHNSLLTLVHNESSSLNESFSLIQNLAKKHNLSFSEITELLLHKENYISLPLTLFDSHHAPLEALVHYLKEVLGYSLKKIATLLSRDETTIWTTYHNSLKKTQKEKEHTFSTPSNLIVPLSIFSSRTCSILEHLCLYLKEEHSLSYHNIGLLLGRNERTIWTVVNRARKKLK